MAKDITKAIDNINLGITNKVRNSAFLNGKESWNLSTNVTIDTEMTLDGHPSCKSSQTGLTANAWRGCINYNLPNNQTSFKEGDVITISCYYYVQDKSPFDGRLTLECKGKKEGATSESGMGSVSVSAANLVENKWVKLTKTITLTENYNDVCIRAWVERNGIAWFTNFTLVSGNKTGDWSPSPEDVDTSIANVGTQIATTSNKVAIIETNLSSITQRLSSTESTLNSHTTQINAVDEKINSKVVEIKATTDTITSKVEIIESTTTTINGNITNLQSKVNTVESKITGTAIVNTISEAITGGTGSISTTQFVMDKNGLTIKNGALTIQNKAGTIVLNSDTNGNLIVTGTLKSQSGAQFVSMNSGGIDFQDWNKNEQMLRVGISYFDSNRDMNGVTFALAKYGDFIRFSHVVKDDLTNGWTSSDTQYNFFDCWSGDQTVGGISYKKGINVYAPMYINNGLKLYSGTTHLSEILGSVSWNNGTGTVSNMLGLYGDNGAVLGFKSGENLQARFIVTEAAHPGTGDNLISFGNYNFNGYTFHNANIVAKSLSVSGSKNCLQETKSYGARLINAYETAEYYFGDLGFGKINSDGECLAYIDDIFLECVNTNAAYHVFTQIYNGKITSIERYTTYVVIKGEPGTNFSWQLMGKRKGYENNRLDTQEIETQGENKIELFGYEDFKVETSENTLIDVLTFELEDLLLMEG